MDNPAEKVFQNDYIMAHILRMLDLKQQYEIQKICERLRFLLTTCVWRRDCKEMEMNRNQMGKLTDEEFFEVLQLNAENLQILSIDGLDGAGCLLYFPVRFENLLELRIKSFHLCDSVFTTIAGNCPQLQLFEYNENRDVTILAGNEPQSLEMLWTLSNLRAVILQNLVRKIFCKDLYALATKVPLERLELYNVEMSGAVWDNSSWVLPRLKVFKRNCTNTPYQSNDKCLVLIGKCQNLQELGLYSTLELNEYFFDRFLHLEKLILKNYISFAVVWRILSIRKLKCLEILFASYGKENFQIIEDVRGICGSLENLKVTKALDSVSNFWPVIFQSPLSNFDSLQELTFTNEEMSDDVIRSISTKCQQLKSLHLTHCKISGKYINHLTNLRRLTIILNSLSIPWANFYPILRDLQLLEYLEIDCCSLLADFVDIPPNVKNVANSLEVLKIYRPETGSSFWEHILDNCECSFQKVHTIHLVDFGIDDYYDNAYFTIFNQLHTVQLERGSSICAEDFVSEGLVSPVKHLTLKGCMDVKWTDIVEILKCTHLQIFEVFNMKLEVCDFETYSMQDYMNILQRMCKITIPFDIFVETLPFYQRCLATCPKFQLCCMSHSCHREVLCRLFKNSPAKIRLKAIHANRDLNSIKSYCAENMGAAKIPVYLLDADNEKLWNAEYIGIKNVIILEV